MKVIETRGPEETYNIALSIGREAAPGAVIALTGNLGIGKTVFAKGIAAGLGIKDHVSSPTYTIVQQYDGGRLPMYHFDVYRIGDITEMDETGYEDFFYGDGVTVVEWADIVRDIMPDDTCWIRIKGNPDKGYEYRRIVISDEYTSD
ncbi:MAG: tRNA (adenosine(37)-N6)-threonylcarbamoyltransferase complex ATPase subunit type 1 TsaE [Lachnospiraceae bacterium]|nr:tRNA (adenosine(37)-N6)-threonylcarbamoyltransferase complex ATPase subunit type 1 TsaE [Lachnospiraceae bacterium]MBQ9605799.1 tRNA (adenosine(37)-N6)-threonylcarbamoyltransferase complex ATPase subunit type 1 TsaE [Lachnospiraceae bacterium]MBR1522855.1 tRNA (adenosine(37)-N6)-threonylcarbamoyltransferase complex ATPase subunit type 1 TsaE [Lachnospiraceae bacterium]